MEIAGEKCSLRWLVTGDFSNAHCELFLVLDVLAFPTLDPYCSPYISAWNVVSSMFLV